MWRYRPLLPRLDATQVRRRVFMGEGGTPLVRSRAMYARSLAVLKKAKAMVNGKVAYDTRREPRRF